MFAAEVPSQLKNLLRSFPLLLSKQQQNNLAIFEIGFMTPREEKKKVKGIGDSVPHKDWSALDRFVRDRCEVGLQNSEREKGEAS
jgi:hypothetical protein